MGDHETRQVMHKAPTFDGELENSGQMQTAASSGQTIQINAPNPAPKAVPTGWKCPICEHGVAPDVKVCPCQDKNLFQFIPSTAPVYIPYYVPYYDPNGPAPSPTIVPMPRWQWISSPTVVPWYTVQVKS